uniref:Major facilitator superfamily (MFS) profile domain-containing protein n=1 Tax=Timema bartmani TaxID=61472 RepID=A0A7R9I557_9NEOP|nr:unnamed protein product [Timema bartmani]
MSKQVDYTLVPVKALEEPAKCKLQEDTKVKVYPRRWLMLLMFSVCLLVNCVQWIQYSIIPQVITRYYNVSTTLVDFTSIIYLVIFVPAIFPASYILDRLASLLMGLRWATLLGAGLTALGAWMKVWSVSPDRFLITLLGQTVVGLGQVFQLTTSPRMAAVWFGPDQVATACSIGVFGNQFGVALGFLVVPLIIKNHDTLLDIGSDLSFMFYTLAGITSIVFIIVLICEFQPGHRDKNEATRTTACDALLYMRVAILSDYGQATKTYSQTNEPPLPPSLGQALQRATAREGHKNDFLGSIKRLLCNSNYTIHLMAYGINVGMYNTVCTLLGQLIEIRFQNTEDWEQFAGRIGLLIVLVGTAGSMVFGFILDKTHKYKETTLAVYILTVLGMVGFSFSLASESRLLVYITAVLLGFFMGGYMPVGFEVGSELTYPEPEGTATGMLFIPPSILGVVFTLLYSWLIGVIGDLWASLVFVGILGIGAILTACIRKDYRRLTANTGPKHRHQDLN